MSAQNSITSFTIYIMFSQSKRRNEEGELTKNLDTHTKTETTRNMMKEEKRKEKLNEKKTQDGLVARVLVSIPRARNSSRKLRAYSDVPGK
jgi:hypothetical protein